MPNEGNDAAAELVQKLVNDPDTAQRFQQDRDGVLSEHELSAEERDAFTQLDLDELRETTNKLKNITQARVGSLYIAQ